MVLNNNFLKENGTFVLEHQSKMKLEHPQLIETRKYGNVSFFSLKQKENDETSEILIFDSKVFSSKLILFPKNFSKFSRSFS